MKPADKEGARLQIPLSRILLAVADARTQLRSGASLNTVIRPMLQKLPADSRPTAQALTYESVRRAALSKHLLKALCSRTPANAVVSLLEASLAALLLGRFSAYTVVSEAVNASKAVPATRVASGFVNAVLRRFLREKDDLCKRALLSPEVRFNAPLWWLDRMHRAHPADAERILGIATRHPPMTLRVNCRKSTPATYLATLAEAGINAKQVGKDAVMLAAPLPVDRIPGFNEGLVSVQDAGTQLAADFLPVKPGDRVLDACAAPGGKTAHLLEHCDCSMTALEIDPVRTDKIRETLGRLGLTADVRTADAARTAKWWDGKPFDAILLDAPCTASGVVRRQPDTPWLRRPDDIRHLASEQNILLRSLWPLLKNDGFLLYATCSVFPEEGTEQIRRFIADTPNAELVPLFSGNNGMLTLLPEESDTWKAGDVLPSVHDGFFYALLRKRA